MAITYYPQYSLLATVTGLVSTTGSSYIVGTVTITGEAIVSVANLSIEQVTGDAHNTYNIAVAGMDVAGNVRPFALTTHGNLFVYQPSATCLQMTETSASYILSAVRGSTLFGTFQRTVTTATTQLQFPSFSCRSVTIKAHTTNTNFIFVGDLNVDSNSGFILSPGDTLSLDVSNTNLIWIDSLANFDGVSVAYV